jgi:hypothetical protein
MTNFFEGLFGIQNYKPTALALLIGLLGAQMFFAMVSATIIVDDETKKKIKTGKFNEPKVAYGGILITTSLIWMVFLLIAFIYLFKLNSTF